MISVPPAREPRSGVMYWIVGIYVISTAWAGNTRRPAHTSSAANSATRGITGFVARMGVVALIWKGLVMRMLFSLSVAGLSGLDDEVLACQHCDLHCAESNEQVHGNMQHAAQTASVNTLLVRACCLWATVVTESNSIHKRGPRSTNSFCLWKIIALRNPRGSHVISEFRAQSASRPGRS